MNTTEENGKAQYSYNKGVVFYIGLISAVYHAVVHAGIVAKVSIPWWVGAIGVALSAVLMYCNGKKTSTATDETDDI
ncbi:MAG: hypothetical protein J1E60_06850 [Christensenellaceae bacterium]|nr:hypothetical protein [Christensenellaceae bacterium]